MLENLIAAYLNEARPFALAHALLGLVCIVILIKQRIHLGRERAAHKIASATGLLPSPSRSRLHIEKVAALAAALAQKGKVPDVDSLNRRLSRLLSGQDGLLHVCTNGLIIVGLLGTLFNLYRLGPEFWNKLFEGAVLKDQREAIGVAFAASFFGLLWALLLTLIDNLFFRPPREKFAEAASEWIASKTVEQLPLSREAAVAQGLQTFIQTAATLMREMQTRQDALTQGLIGQIQSSSQALDARLSAIANSWGEFLNQATDKVKEGGREIQRAARQLTEATTHASHTLTETTKTLESYKNLSQLIAEVRTESARLVSEVTQRLEQFSKQMETTIVNVTQ